MLHAAFAEAYNPAESAIRLSDGVTPDQLEWGHYFGRVLHSYLTTGAAPELTTGNIDAYNNWQERTFVPWFRRLSISDSTELDTNACGFHALNNAAVNNWGGQWAGIPEKVRRQEITEQQDLLGLMAIRLYASHERLFNQYAKTGVKTKRQEEVEGLLSEFDAGIVLLGIQARNPEIEYVVPAPYQFESSKRAAVNADFVVLTKTQAVGVQVKSRVHEGDVAKYDPRRIMLLDGRHEMGNARAKKVVGKSAKEVVNWPGIISAQHITQLNSKAPNIAALDSRQQQLLTRFKFLAKSLVIGIRPNVHQAIEGVEKRLLPRLADEVVLELPDQAEAASA